jgi:hypothetical protein
LPPEMAKQVEAYLTKRSSHDCATRHPTSSR